MPTTKFYKYPFGVTGDRSAISNEPAPLTPANSGVVTYEYGFTPNYEYDLATDPNALPIPRNQSNQLYYDITLNIQQYQTQGTPNFITSADNGGTAYAYPIYARCLYSGQLYENQVAGNTQTPGVDSTWSVISGGAQSVPTGTIIDFAGVSAPSGYLKCDGTAVSRTTYSLLLTALTESEYVNLTSGLDTFTVVSSTNYYIGMSIEGNGVTAGTTITNISGTTITMSNVATTTALEQITFFNWGAGDGSTTFNVPDFRRTVSMGSGGSGTLTIGNVTGQKGGTEAVTLGVNEIPAHNHAYVYDTVTTGFGFGYAQGTNHGLVTANTQNTGGGLAHNNVQPSAIVTKCIKY